ncbi:hypothetical protein [Asanoa iriomotensis]|uniref:Uncharacterized protein n=1 Tax=Asanoa iriomotensis TaxID=234613 RepID=A0ABQ4C5E1_9ACTN|nr:hypothetical protein [Asanoa iriomotensis]GIF57974.1 hypothetical protein Air01nite_40690 [Asanoa iriomotensis]
MRARLWLTVAAPAALLHGGRSHHAPTVITTGARMLLTVTALALLLYTIGAPVSNGG